MNDIQAARAGAFLRGPIAKEAIEILKQRGISDERANELIVNAFKVRDSPENDGDLINAIDDSPFAAACTPGERKALEVVFGVTRPLGKKIRKSIPTGYDEESDTIEYYELSQAPSTLRGNYSKKGLIYRAVLEAQSKSTSFTFSADGVEQISNWVLDSLQVGITLDVVWYGFYSESIGSLMRFSEDTAYKLEEDFWGFFGIGYRLHDDPKSNTKGFALRW